MLNKCLLFLKYESCSLCFDIIDIYWCYPIHLKSYRNHKTNCQCNVFVHKYCLEEYYKHFYKCIICGKPNHKIERNYINHEFKFIINIQIIYTFLLLFKLFIIYKQICITLKIN
jgi:hypothetical protein